MQRKLALIDADSIIFILAWHNREHQDVSSMELQVDQFMVDLIQQTGATHYVGVFTPGRTFRDVIYPEYKANRKKGDGPPPHIAFWKPIIKKLCADKYGFFQPDMLEADDVLSILRGPYPDTEVIFCSPDKDLRQIPGKHYDYSKQKWEEISKDEASVRFWTQMLVGDSTDNIPGCRGIGEKKAPAIIEKDSTDLERRESVRTAYLQNKKYESSAEAQEQFYLMEKLLTLRLPTFGHVTEFSRFVQEVAYNEAELNIDDGILQSDQRLQQSDVLRAAADLSEQV